MADQSSKPPSGTPPKVNELSGAATVMLEAPVLPQATPSPARPVAEQKTAILDTESPEMASVQAKIAEARSRTGPPPAATPVAEQKTAILDAAAPEMAAVQARIEEARARPAAHAPTPVAELKTAILDTHSPEMASVQARLADARVRAAAVSPSPSSGSPITDQKTAILDSASPELAGVQAKIAEARGRGHAGSGAPPPAPLAAPPAMDQKTAILDVASPELAGRGGPPAGAGRAGASAVQRTASLDVGGQMPPSTRSVPARSSRSQQQQIAMPTRPATWLRWVVGPLVSLLTAGATYAAAGVLLPSRPVITVTPPPPPPPTPVGRIHLETSPPGASVTVAGKPHPRFTPTDIEGPIGETAIHVGVKLEGYKAQEQDVLFTSIPQKLTLTLEKREEVPAPRKPGGRHSSGGRGSGRSGAASGEHHVWP